MVKFMRSNFPVAVPTTLPVDSSISCDGSHLWNWKTSRGPPLVKRTSNSECIRELALITLLNPRLSVRNESEPGGPGITDLPANGPLVSTRVNPVIEPGMNAFIQNFTVSMTTSLGGSGGGTGVTAACTSTITLD